MGLGRFARRLSLAVLAGLCGLALMAFDVPLPVPSVTPTVPAPLPSIPALLGSQSSAPGQQQATAPRASQSAPASRPASDTPSLSAAALATAPVVRQPADGPLQTRVEAAAVTAPQLGAATAAASTPGGPGAPEAPLPALLLAAFGAALALLVRRLGPLPGRRSGRVRLEVTPLTDSALDAIARLCESVLPAEATVRRRGDALAVEPGGAGPAEVEQALARVTTRARRVGIDVFCVGPESRPQVADQLVPA